MKRRQVVKSKILFNEIIKNGLRNSNKYFVICSSKDINVEKKFGIAVGKKLGNAVVRNKIKRQIRNIIDNNYNLFSNNYNYIIISKKEILNLNYHEMENELVNLIKKGDNYEK